MKKRNDLLLLNIDLKSFEGEGGATGGATGGEGGVATTPTKAVEGKAPEILYGKQDNQDGATDGDPSGGDLQSDPSAEFEGLIKGQYKEQFEARIQSIIDKRFKAAKETEGKLNQQDPIIRLLMDKYEVNTEADLFAKVESETIEELAYKANMDVDTYKEFRDSKFKADLYDKHQNSEDWKAQADEKVAKWFQDADALKVEYPDFDLKTYADSEPEFVKLLEAGIPVKKAYEVLNIDNIKANSASTAAKQAQSNTIKSIQANGHRPSEAAAQSTNGTIIKSSVSNLNKVDRAEIAKRAQRGDKISF